MSESMLFPSSWKYTKPYITSKHCMKRQSKEPNRPARTSASHEVHLQWGTKKTQKNCILYLICFCCFLQARWNQQQISLMLQHTNSSKKWIKLMFPSKSTWSELEIIRFLIKKRSAHCIGRWPLYCSWPCWPYRWTDGRHDKLSLL